VKRQQERAKRRLAKFLDAATKLLAEIGYEAATIDCHRRGNEISAVNCWSALKAGQLVARREV